MGSRARNSLSMLSMTTSRHEVQWIPSGGKNEISKKDTDLLRSLFIKQQCYAVVKRYIKTLMNLTGAPAHCWLLCLVYVCALLNVTASPALYGITPIQALTGQIPGISHFLYFFFEEPISTRFMTPLNQLWSAWHQVAINFTICLVSTRNTVTSFSLLQNTPLGGTIS